MTPVAGKVVRCGRGEQVSNRGMILSRDFKNLKADRNCCCFLTFTAAWGGGRPFPLAPPSSPLARWISARFRRHGGMFECFSVALKIQRHFFWLSFGKPLKTWLKNGLDLREWMFPSLCQDGLWAVESRGRSQTFLKYSSRESVACFVPSDERRDIFVTFGIDWIPRPLWIAF